ncbi:hypothetical protein NEOLEDRAFT_1138443 [Neolentinus lepideus HHB14362 ss-1]|uniref:Thioredoxin-like fold domain-containing protein n=1 Tax=Neolentinus lepideus HHB14362 ss-1 TaxID=1314782 RepID=A0A165Q9F2_9AGAM|nr:hypothetical protein NEOLEDRAFT_1138443 [Neolentinus lepideus HHB14362 ss-1]
MSGSERIQLHVVPKADANNPSSSGFCQKLESYLRATSVPYEYVTAYPFQAPKGKVPFVTMPSGEKIPDSHFIIRHLKATGVTKDLDADLTPAQKADSRAWQAWLEEIVYNCMVYERWIDDAGYVESAKEFQDQAPWPLGSLLAWYFRRRIRNALYYAGIGRHSIDEVHTLEKEFVDALDAKFADGREYFHETSSPTEIDIFLYAFITQGLSQNGNPYFTGLVMEKRALKDFAKKMLEKLHPEYEGVEKMLQT